MVLAQALFPFVKNNGYRVDLTGETKSMWLNEGWSCPSETYPVVFII